MVLGAVYPPDRARFSRLRSSTAISESMPSSKNLTDGDGADGSRSTACNSPCRNDTNKPSRSPSGAPRSLESRLLEGDGVSALLATALGSSSSMSGMGRGRLAGVRGQSMEATAAENASTRTIRSRARMPCWGVIQSVP